MAKGEREGEVVDVDVAMDVNGMHRARPTRRTAVALAVAYATAGALVVTGCGSGQPEAAGTEAGQVRRDRGPVEARFPQLGSFESVVWASEVLGTGNDRSVPGPSDVRMSGVVQLTSAQAEKLQKRHTWHPAPDRPDVVGPLTSHVPKPDAWTTSDDFTHRVSGGRYTLSFWLDATREVLVFDAINPERLGTVP